MSHTAPATSAHTAWTPGGATTTGDGWIFFPASRHSTAPRGTIGFPARAAAAFAAKVIRATGHNAWHGTHNGITGLFIATS